VAQLPVFWHLRGKEIAQTRCNRAQPSPMTAAAMAERKPVQYVLYRKIVGLTRVGLSDDPDAQRRELFPGHTALALGVYTLPPCHLTPKAEISPWFPLRGHLRDITSAMTNTIPPP